MTTVNSIKSFADDSLAIPPSIVQVSCTTQGYRCSVEKLT